eukprot:1161568-Pelagomonas_calceolata.AAC.6
MAQEWPWHWLALAEPPDPYSLALLFVGNQPAAKFTVQGFIPFCVPTTLKEDQKRPNQCPKLY